MSLFADQTTVALRDPRALAALLDPPADRAHQRVRTLVGAMYELPYATIAEVRDLTVGALELQLPLELPRETRGSWQQTAPGQARSEFRWEEAPATPPLWVDLAADVALTLVVDADLAEVQSIRVHELETRVQLKPLPRFDPDDPANQLGFRLRVALLVRDGLDLTEALRAAKLTRELLRRTVAFERLAPGGTERSAPFAPLLVFPAAALAASRFTEPQLTALFAAERVAIAFANP